MSIQWVRNYNLIRNLWRALYMSFTYKSCCVLYSAWMYPTVSPRAFCKKSCFVFSSPNLSCPFSSLPFASLFSARCACLLFLQLLHHLFLWFDGNDLCAQYQMCILHQLFLSTRLLGLSLFLGSLVFLPGFWEHLFHHVLPLQLLTEFCLCFLLLTTCLQMDTKQLSIDPHATPSALPWWLRW